MSKSDPLAMLPPQNLDAERSVIGSLLLGGQEAFDELNEELRPELRAEEFYADSHRRIFGAALRCWQSSTSVDAITVAEALEGRKELEEIGGAPYLAECMAAVPHAAHVVHHATIVREKFQARRVLEICTRGIRDANDAHDGLDVRDVIGRIESGLHGLLDADAGSSVVEVHEALLELMSATEEQSRATPTGWPGLDDLLRGGLQPGRLYILAARTSVGKTAFAVNMARHVARKGEPVLFVSLEQSRNEIIERLLASMSGVDSERVLGLLNDASGESADRQTVIECANRLAELPLTFDDASSRSVAQIASVARVRKRRKGLGLLIVDYLTLVTPDDRRVQREQQVAAISRSMKVLAKDLEIPVVCLAQLNRSIEGREKKRPRLSDLRESGAVEQDADAVLFLDRPAAYDDKADPTEARVIVAKNRQGKVGDVVLRWDAPTVTFQSKAPAHQAEGLF